MCKPVKASMTSIKWGTNRDQLKTTRRLEETAHLYNGVLKQEKFCWLFPPPTPRGTEGGWGKTLVKLSFFHLTQALLPISKKC